MKFPKLAGIYCILNISNSKVYIGSSIHIRTRWDRHKSDLRCGVHQSAHLQRAWIKYGEQNFKFFIIEVVLNATKEKLLSREQLFINYNQSYDILHGYNILKIAGSRLGAEHTDAAKEKMSTYRKGSKLSETTKLKIGAAHKGRKFSEHTIKLIVAKNKGRVFSSEARLNMSKGQMGKKQTEASKLKRSLSALAYWQNKKSQMNKACE